MVKGFPPFPSLSCRNNTGPSESSFIQTAIISIGTSSKTPNTKETTMSNIRLKNKYGLLPETFMKSSASMFLATAVSASTLFGFKSTFCFLIHQPMRRQSVRNSGAAFPLINKIFCAQKQMQKSTCCNAYNFIILPHEPYVGNAFDAKSGLKI